ncbi:MAG: non-canonical purine NTP diphosphatase [Dysgonamonadaceae bacterium]|jgi:XTP/dITP diphosphohydrolase|nr:non-canonical purine NTP diphosphatase [Dysgonamonadaceae bacterium]
MKKQLVFATNNNHKLEEVREILGDAFRILSLKDIGCTEEIPETADTLEGNALLKARYVKTNYRLDCFSDDTGLEVTALNNAPGVYSARYAGEAKDSKANRQKVLRELEGKKDYSARFRTVIALVTDGQERLFEGIVNGCLVREERGTAGFGYDPIFVPEGFGETFAEMGTVLKNTISHRANAINKLKLFLDENDPV